MIDYKLFEFAAPPCTHEQWYVKAFQLVGLGPGFSKRIHEAWEKGSQHRLIRLSLVRNPLNWLFDFFFMVQQGTQFNGTFAKLATLDFSSIDKFAESYLEKASGSITALYNRYEADIVHRAEDIPWAFVEYMNTLEVPSTMIKQAQKLSPPQSSIKTIPIWLRREIQKAEKETFERYDYYG